MPERTATNSLYAAKHLKRIETTTERWISCCSPITELASEIISGLMIPGDHVLNLCANTYDVVFSSLNQLGGTCLDRTALRSGPSDPSRGFSAASPTPAPSRCPTWLSPAPSRRFGRFGSHSRTPWPGRRARSSAAMHGHLPWSMPRNWRERFRQPCLVTPSTHPVSGREHSLQKSDAKQW
jgi:hypothetical protein